MAYSPAIIANYFLDKASKELRAVTPMQLLKLVYIAHGWHLGYFKRPLINEPVEAWRYGPVIKSLYGSLRKYGSGAVAEPIQTGDFPWDRDGDIADEDVARLLDQVWKSYARYSGIELSRMTHMKGTPWDQVWNDRGGKSEYSAVIDNETIRNFYCEKIAEEGAA